MISTIYIFSFSQFGVSAFNSVVNKGNTFAEGTKVGSISIEGKTRNEATQLLNDEITKWQEATTLTLQYKEKIQDFDTTHFTFDVEGTLQQLSQGQTNPVLVGVTGLENFLTSISSSLTPEELKMDELEAEIVKSAGLLSSGSYQIQVESFVIDRNGQFTNLEQTTISMGDLQDQIGTFARQSIEIGSNTQISLLHFVSQQEMDGLSSLALSKIATAIYEVIMPTNFSIIERHISGELPEYADLGFEAKVDAGQNQDLVFFNPNKSSYFIEFENLEGTLNVYLKGSSFLNQYSITTEDRESFQPKTIRQFNPRLGPTEINVKEEGKEGQLIKVFREYIDENGKQIKKELISEDFYPPVHRIEVGGLIVNEGDSSTEEETDEMTENEEDGEDEGETPDDEKESDSDNSEEGDQAEEDETPSADQPAE